MDRLILWGSFRVRVKLFDAWCYRTDLDNFTLTPYILKHILKQQLANRKKLTMLVVVLSQM